MKRTLANILLILLVFTGCRSPNFESTVSTEPPTVTTDSTMVKEEPFVSTADSTVPIEPTVSPTQKNPTPDDVTATETPQSSQPAESSPAETSSVEKSPSPSQPITEPTSPHDTEPVETFPSETQSPEAKPEETVPAETEPPPTSPPETQSTEPTGCNHEWICIHHDEEGHWIAGIICDCGWKIYGDPDELISLWNDHSASFPAVESLFDHGGYGCVDEWILDIPAYDEWVCNHCKEPKP